MLTRIRTVKPELFRHHDLWRAERDTGLPLRLAFIALFTCCDREGRFLWRPEELKVLCLPYDKTDFSRVLDALTTRGFVVKYASGGVEYGCIPTFTKHQNVNNRERESDIPSPTLSDAPPDTSTREARVDDASPRVGHASTTGTGTGTGTGTDIERTPAAPKGAFGYDFLQAWNEAAEPRRCPKVEGMTKRRVSALRARIADGLTLDRFRSAAALMCEDPFLRGGNDSGTVYADFDYALSTKAQKWYDRAAATNGRHAPVKSFLAED